MPPLHTEYLNHEINRLLLHLQSTITFQRESNCALFHSSSLGLETHIIGQQNVILMKLAYPLSILSIHLKSPFVHIPLLQKN